MELICPIQNQALKAQFLQQGFVVIPALFQPDKIHQLQNISSNYFSHKDQAFLYSLMENNPENNHLLHQTISELILPELGQIFTQFKMKSTSLLIKPGISGSEMHLHQDWTFTNEENFSPVTVWIALQHTNPNNGCLFVLPQSHRWFKNYRSHHYETARIDKNALGKKVVSIPVQPGDVVLFHPAVFHGSFPNQSNQDRVVVSSTILPNQAPYLHVKRKNATQAQLFHINDATFFSDLAKLNHSYGFESEQTEVLPYIHSIPTTEDLLFHLNSHV